MKTPIIHIVDRSVKLDHHFTFDRLKFAVNESLKGNSGIKFFVIVSDGSQKEYLMTEMIKCLPKLEALFKVT
jgi:hypothetical protein